MTTPYKFALVVFLFMGVMMLWAQAAAPSLGITSVAASGSTCTVVTGATVTECAATDGLWIAIGTGAFAKVATGTGGGGTAGVTSFNGRTGAVTSIAGDYSYSQLSGTPMQKPSFTCGSANTLSTGVGFSATSCQ